MGQYHYVYNLDKKEKLHAHLLDNGLKLVEQIGFMKSTSTALFLLLANSNGRGGGDVEEHPFVGRWAGDRVVVQGDYANLGDKGYVDEEVYEQFTDVSREVKEMLDTCVPENWQASTIGPNWANF